MARLKTTLRILRQRTSNVEADVLFTLLLPNSYNMHHDSSSHNRSNQPVRLEHPLEVGKSRLPGSGLVSGQTTADKTTE